MKSVKTNKECSLWLNWPLLFKIFESGNIDITTSPFFFGWGEIYSKKMDPPKGFVNVAVRFL